MAFERRRAARMAALLVLFFSTAFLPQVHAQDKAQKIDELIARYHDYGQFDGSVLVSEGGKVIFKKGYGLAEREWDIPNAPDTKFRLGSITKQFTSMLVMQEVEKGELQLDAHLSAYLPYYRKDTGDKITLRNLLTHTAGVPNYTAQPHFFEDISRNPFTVPDFVQKYCSGDLEFAPGSKFSYSNSGYFLLGAVLEQVTGKTYETLLHERIFDPLGMKDTGYDHWPTILPKRATGYEHSLACYQNSPYLDMSIPFAAGAIYSTVEDLYIWDQALYTDKLLSAKSRETMFTPFLASYAFGWIVLQQPIGPQGAPRTVIIHEGGINGFNTLIARTTEDRDLVVLLNNTGGAPLADISHNVFNILYGRPAELPKQPIQGILLKTLNEKGVDAAIAQYRELKSAQAGGYNFDESALNDLGYFLLQQKKFKEAVAILQLNVEAYPQSFNVYDSLGEAYMDSGDTANATKNYTKSLELNPKNTNATEMLKKLQQPKK